MNRKNFVDVDAYQRDTSVEQAAADCGAAVKVTGSGKNVRIDCPFGCDGDHAGKREIAIDTENPAAQWKCHAYGCACRGNLLNLMYGWISGTKWSGEKLRGEEFNVVKKVIAGEKPQATPPPQASAPLQAKEEVPQAAKQNPPLLQGEKSKVLMEPPIWQKLTVDVAAMTPEASAYLRHHPSLSSEAMRK